MGGCQACSCQFNVPVDSMGCVAMEMDDRLSRLGHCIDLVGSVPFPIVAASAVMAVTQTIVDVMTNQKQYMDMAPTRHFV